MKEISVTLPEWKVTESGSHELQVGVFVAEAACYAGGRWLWAVCVMGKAAVIAVVATGPRSGVPELETAKQQAVEGLAEVMGGKLTVPQ